ncbi:hypothetical protein B0H12DRAFT_1092576 [Mycena haematopus]|nr:hypothetical protein B0H12DRAFT_1092576 [Mycena haematopus]
MFMDYCLSCGKQLADERAYCNEECQTGDLTSSDASSPFSSPGQVYAHAVQDVPPLVPSLGHPLHDRYSASSSSASSTTWSLLTDDDDDSEFDDPQLSFSRRPNGLSYARRPSGTNNPHPRRHCRTASLPQSAPGDASSFPDFLPSDNDDEDQFSHPISIPTPTITPATTSKTKLRKRNRASLPTYFSILQINSTASTSSSVPKSPPAVHGISPVSCSSGHTVPARPSPPTPKLTLLAHHTPRPRYSREASRSPSPARRRDSDEKVADWSRRGRASVRRNSPLPGAMASPRAIALMGDSSPSPSRERGETMMRRRSGTRGRARVEELDGPGSADPERPGFGYGRSGLVARTRRRGDEWR